MFNKILGNVYPFLSLGFIEVGSFISNASNLLTLLVFLLQAVIGLLTIIKLWKDIKNKKFKTLEKTEKDAERKNPFLFNLLKYFKK